MDPTLDGIITINVPVGVVEIQGVEEGLVPPLLRHRRLGLGYRVFPACIDLLYIHLLNGGYQVGGFQDRDAAGDMVWSGTTSYSAVLL